MNIEEMAEAHKKARLKEIENMENKKFLEKYGFSKKLKWFFKDLIIQYISNRYDTYSIYIRNKKL